MKVSHAGITDTSDVVQIFTDGACKGNPGIGGWGALIKYGGKVYTGALIPKLDSRVLRFQQFCFQP